MERIATGIQGFDELIEGGLPAGSTTLVAGVPGAAKTIFGLHYIYNGALKGEPGIYISLDSPPEELKQQASRFGMDFSPMEKEDRLKVLFLNIPIARTKFSIFDEIKQAVRQMNAKRIVFDNMTTFAINIDLFTMPVGYMGSTASSVTLNANFVERLNQKDESGLQRTGSEQDTVLYTANSEKRLIYLIIEQLRNLGTTNILIGHGSQTGGAVTTDGVSEFAADAIINLYNDLIGAKHVRTLSILKMRSTNHSPYIHNFEITEKGINVKPAEQVYK